MVESELVLSQNCWNFFLAQFVNWRIWVLLDNIVGNVYLCTWIKFSVLITDYYILCACPSLEEGDASCIQILTSFSLLYKKENAVWFCLQPCTFLCRIFSLTDYMIYILNCFNLYHCPSERQVLIMLVWYEYYMCHKILETDLSWCFLQVLLYLKPLFLPSSVPHLINGESSGVCRLPPVRLLGTEFQIAEMDIPGKYKIGRCVSWEAKVSEKTPWPDTAGKAFLAFSWDLQGALADHWFYILIVKKAHLNSGWFYKSSILTKSLGQVRCLH